MMADEVCTVFPITAAPIKNLYLATLRNRKTTPRQVILQNFLQLPLLPSGNNYV